MSSTYFLHGLMRRYEESPMLSSLSMNSMAKIPDMLEPHGRPSVWQNMPSSKVKYMLNAFLTSKLQSRKTAKAPLSSTKNQRRSHYLYTISQPYLENQRLTSSVMNEDAYSRDAPPKQHPMNTTAHLIISFAKTDTRKTS